MLGIVIDAVARALVMSVTKVSRTFDRSDKSTAFCAKSMASWAVVLDSSRFLWRSPCLLTFVIRRDSPAILERSFSIRSNFASSFRNERSISGALATSSRCSSALVSLSSITPMVAFVLRRSEAAAASESSMTPRLMIWFKDRLTCPGVSENQNGASCCSWKLTSLMFNKEAMGMGTSFPKATYSCLFSL